MLKKTWVSYGIILLVSGTLFAVSLPVHAARQSVPESVATTPAAFLSSLQSAVFTNVVSLTQNASSFVASARTTVTEAYTSLSKAAASVRYRCDRED